METSVAYSRISLQQPILLLFCFPLFFSSCFSSSFLSDSYDQKSCSHFSQLKSKGAVITSTTKPSFQPLAVLYPFGCSPFQQNGENYVHEGPYLPSKSSDWLSISYLIDNIWRSSLTLLIFVILLDIIGFRFSSYLSSNFYHLF